VKSNFRLTILGEFAARSTNATILGYITDAGRENTDDNDADNGRQSTHNAFQFIFVIP